MSSLTRLMLVPFVAWGLAACDAKQTQEGKAPDVDVQGGQLPKYDVDTADVDVGTEQREITVPTVDVTPPSEQREERSGG